MRLLLLCSMFAILIVDGVSITKVDAAAGTTVVARTGRPVSNSSTWPKGIDELVNDPARTDGWNDWFTQWPSDVNHYAYRIEDATDINRLLKKLAAVKSELRQIRLSPRKEPSSLGWVTRLPKGNGAAAIFSIGNQQRLDEWHRRLPDGRFGAMTFRAAPVAVPPTLTIYIGNYAVDLEKLELPEEMKVELGDCPRIFHKWNTDLEAERLKEKGRDSEEYLKSLSEGELKVADRIAKFLEGRKSDKRSVDHDR